MGVGEHEHSTFVTFYPWGLAAGNEVLEKGRGWPMKTMATLLVELGDEDVSGALFVKSRALIIIHEI